MRFLAWILGSVAAAAAAAYVSYLRAKKSVIVGFAVSLEAKRVRVHAESTGISAPNVRTQRFIGTADGTAFRFIAITDKTGTTWTFVLAWNGERAFERWNALKHDRAQTLASIHLALKRLGIQEKDG